MPASFRRFLSSDGLDILVGKAASDNDHLTFKIASQDDFWLHVAGTPGSHVILRNPQHLERPPKASLQEAANLAAFYSKSRDGGRVSVHYTQRRFVSKPSGSPAGQVLLKQFKSVSASPKDHLTEEIPED